MHRPQVGPAVQAEHRHRPLTAALRHQPDRVLIHAPVFQGSPNRLGELGQGVMLEQPQHADEPARAPREVVAVDHRLGVVLKEGSLAFRAAMILSRPSRITASASPAKPRAAIPPASFTSGVWKM